MATKPAQQKICEGVLQTKGKNKASMSPQEKIKIMLKYQPKEEKNTKFHKNQPNDRNQYTIFNKPLDISSFISPNQKTD